MRHIILIQITFQIKLDSCIFYVNFNQLTLTPCLKNGQIMNKTKLTYPTQCDNTQTPLTTVITCTGHYRMLLNAVHDSELFDMH